MSAVQLLNELGLRSDLKLTVTSRVPATDLAALDQIAADARVSRSRMASALLQDGIRRYAAAA